MAALASFALVFAAGFALGALRALWLGPLIGETAALALELPLMLAVSWRATGWCIRRFAVPARLWPRLRMGAAAFALLMLAEMLLAAVLSGGDVAAISARWTGAPRLLGLADQVVYGFMPALALAADRRARLNEGSPAAPPPPPPARAQPPPA
jgi:hypothetical protein